MNYRKYKIRTCRWLNECNLCKQNIVNGEKYYDGGSGRRAHLICNDITGGLEFVRWMKGRGDAYKMLRIKTYQDGEPYFSSQGAEMSLSEFLKREKELTLTPHYQLTYKYMKKYQIIYADPPWGYNDKQNTKILGGAIKHYPLMSTKSISELPIKNITEENAVLFLWTTSPLLEESFSVIKGWGFKYKTSFIWDKIKHNMGHYNSVRHEILLIATKGSCTPQVKKLFDSVISEERKEHSKKPQVFREIINTIYPTGNRIELFAREKTEGWDVWGNEVESDIDFNPITN